MTYPGAAPPRIDPRQLRPGRGWYWVAAIIALLGILIAPVLLVVGVSVFGATVDDLPTIDRQFSSGSQTTVSLRAAETAAIYAVTPDDGSAPSATCTGTAPAGATIDLNPISYEATFSVGGTSWTELYTVDVSQDGDYQITCTSPGNSFVQYGVGEEIEVGGLVAGILGGTGALLGVILAPCTGLLIAGIICLITALRRSSYRNRLQRQWMGY
jgi:hypothetical protein